MTRSWISVSGICALMALTSLLALILGVGRDGVSSLGTGILAVGTLGLAITTRLAVRKGKGNERHLMVGSATFAIVLVAATGSVNLGLVAIVGALLVMASRRLEAGHEARRTDGEN